jgi:hypothetical protein
MSAEGGLAWLLACVDLGEGADTLVYKEGLTHGSRVGHARRLYDDTIEAVLAPLELLEYLDEVSTHCAAHTAVRHIENNLVVLELSGVINGSLSEQSLCAWQRKQFLDLCDWNGWSNSELFCQFFCILHLRSWS